MPVRIADNMPEYLRGLDRASPQSRQFVLELGNAMDYALYLHAKEGYSVLNEQHWLSVVVRFLERLTSGTGPMDDRAVIGALNAATAEEVQFLQSFAARFQPPVRKGGPTRPAHPGNWADRTTRLAGAYYSAINGGERKTYAYEGVRYE